jgi:hypothetical protein
MITIEKHATVVDRLLRKTQAGDLDWKAAADDDTFQVSFRDSSLRIQETRVNRRGQSTVDYIISLINAEGAVVETFSGVQLDEAFGDSFSETWFFKTKELHELARRTALGSDKILNEILEELDDDLKF